MRHTVSILVTTLFFVLTCLPAQAWGPGWSLRVHGIWLDPNIDFDDANERNPDVELTPLLAYTRFGDLLFVPEAGDPLVLDGHGEFGWGL